LHGGPWCWQPLRRAAGRCGAVAMRVAELVVNRGAGGVVHLVVAARSVVPVVVALVVVIAALVVLAVAMQCRRWRWWRT
jgi:uncharacterized membrane protein YcaP (DUF421 family)